VIPLPAARKISIAVAAAVSQIVPLRMVFSFGRRE
jgi:hypothetical protein